MLYDQFVITHFDVTTGKGYARQTVNANRSPLRMEPIGFSTGIGKGTCEYTSSGGIRIPSEEIAQRVPEIGTSIMGVIALDLGESTAELDEHGFPFLRNWFYKDQHDEVEARELVTDDDLMETDQDDYPDDDFGDEEVPSTGTVYARALTTFRGDRGLAHEATEMYPGYFSSCQE